MRALKFLSVCLLVSVLVLPALAQEGDPPSLARSYSLKINPGHDAEFEAAMKKQMAWYKKNNETWHWHSWQWLTGPNVGQFIVRSPGHHWKDLDDRAERTERARAHFMEHVGPHVEFTGAAIGDILTDISRWPTDTTMVPMVSVHTFHVRYGMAERFHHTLEQIHAAIVEADWPVHYAWGVTVSGDEAGTYWLVVPHENWASFEAPDKPFWAMIEETVGRPEAEDIRKDLMKCVREQHTAVARFRPELSYLPSE